MLNLTVIIKQKQKVKKGGTPLARYVRPFSMLCEVEAYLFFLWSNPYAAWPHCIHYLDNDCSDTQRPRNGRKCTGCVFVQLVRVAEGKSVITPWGEPLFCKDAREQCAAKTAHAVHSPRIQYIVPFAPILEHD